MRIRGSIAAIALVGLFMGCASDHAQGEGRYSYRSEGRWQGSYPYGVTHGGFVHSAPPGGWDNGHGTIIMPRTTHVYSPYDQHHVQQFGHGCQRSCCLPVQHVRPIQHVQPTHMQPAVPMASGGNTVNVYVMPAQSGGSSAPVHVAPPPLEKPRLYEPQRQKKKDCCN